MVLLKTENIYIYYSILSIMYHVWHINLDTSSIIFVSQKLLPHWTSVAQGLRRWPWLESNLSDRSWYLEASQRSLMATCKSLFPTQQNEYTWDNLYQFVSNCNQFVINCDIVLVRYPHKFDYGNFHRQLLQWAWCDSSTVAASVMLQ